MPPVTSGHSKNSCGFHDDNCSANCAGFGDRIISFNYEIHVVGDLRDESFNGDWRGPWRNYFYEIFCHHVIVDKAIGGPKVSEDLESGRVSVSLCGMFQCLHVDGGNSYEKDTLQVIVDLMIKGIIFS